MLFLGHIAASLLIADATDTDRAAAVAGNLLPDVVDKAGAWGLKLFPSARWLAHGLPFYGLSCYAALRLLDPKRGRGFAYGYLGHLIGDLYGGGRVPWFAPFERPRRDQKPRWFSLKVLAPELIGAPIILRLLFPPRRPQ